MGPRPSPNVQLSIQRAGPSCRSNTALLQEYLTNCSLLSISSSLFMSSVEVRLCAGDAAFNAINNIDGGTDLSGLLMTCPVFSLTLT